MKKKKKKPDFSAFFGLHGDVCSDLDPEIYVEFLQHMNNLDANQILKR